MRRPHPRFDTARDAWVTRAGGKLKILAKGPQNANTEAAAWDAFYVHMAKLGTPVEGSSIPVMTLGSLANKYGAMLTTVGGASSPVGEPVCRSGCRDDGCTSPPGPGGAAAP